MKQVNLYYGYINQVTIDANKHPDEQIKDLENHIKNSTEEIINIYSNSPYVMFNITLMEAYTNGNIPYDKMKFKGVYITNKHFEVKENGEIIEGKYYKNMISDENLLNNKLAETNDFYSDFLDLKDEIDKVKTN